MTRKRQGSLACVGVGITLGSHLTPLARSCIEQADVVFVAVSDAIVEQWLRGLHPDVRSLQPYYAEGKPRAETYRQMVDALLAEVRAGRNVCAAFYGHPGVFAWPPHQAIVVARQEGYPARMEPGISAEDCLYADLGIDPGTFGCQHYEAQQLLVYRRRLDTSAYLVLWQAGLVGDQSLARLSTAAKYRRLLAEVLGRDYPPDHPILIYRAATLPIEPPRIKRVTLRGLARVRIEAPDTLVLAPARPLRPNATLRRRLAELASSRGR